MSIRSLRWPPWRFLDDYREMIYYNFIKRRSEEQFYESLMATFAEQASSRAIGQRLKSSFPIQVNFTYVKIKGCPSFLGYKRLDNSVGRDFSACKIGVDRANVKYVM